MEDYRRTFVPLLSCRTSQDSESAGPQDDFSKPIGRRHLQIAVQHDHVTHRCLDLSAPLRGPERTSVRERSRELINGLPLAEMTDHRINRRNHGVLRNDGHYCVEIPIGALMDYRPDLYWAGDTGDNGDISASERPAPATAIRLPDLTSRNLDPMAAAAAPITNGASTDP